MLKLLRFSLGHFIQGLVLLLVMIPVVSCPLLKRVLVSCPHDHLTGLQRDELTIVLLHKDLFVLGSRGRNCACVAVINWIASKEVRVGGDLLVGRPVGEVEVKVIVGPGVVLVVVAVARGEGGRVGVVGVGAEAMDVVRVGALVVI